MNFTGNSGLGPVPLDQRSRRWFSPKSMRDVDLFVGVSSVGNDPNWGTTEPPGRLRAYWNDYSFGSAL